MNKFLYLFGYQTPGEQFYEKTAQQDSQTTMAFWIEADSKKQAEDWGGKVAEAYVKTLYSNQQPKYCSISLTPWHKGLISNPNEWNDEQLKDVITIPLGTMPDVKPLIEKLHGQGPW